MTREWLRVGALLMAVVLTGCASAPPKPVVEAQTLEAEAPAECGAQPSSGNRFTRLGRAIGYGTLGMFLGALQGASDGVNWSRWGGGGWSSNGAWIGAAAGAGVGLLIGFVRGVAKAGSGWSPEPAAPPPCPAAVAEATAPAEGN